MSAQIGWTDWLVIGLYLVGLVLLSLYLSRSQHSRSDYYVGNHGIGPWAIAISTMATQCSTSSILGAPAFVAFAAGGGLVWLQYELAVPLAMIAIMVFLFPAFYRLNLISVYEYLERRFDLKTRLILSGIFQFVRAFATAVTVYGISLVIELITGLPFFWSVVLIGAITLLYDVLGGIRAVIYSDVLQMLILVVVLLGLLALLLADLGGFSGIFSALPSGRVKSLDFAATGLGDGQTFAFWPMLIGGFFLYVSYYGCDQSQVQRELCSRNLNDGRKALFLNGILRFPFVLLYCLLGVAVAAFALHNPGFIDSLPKDAGQPNYNLAVPLMMTKMLPHGLIGLGMVALFAAAMSSLDSVINSLSATTMEDFVRRFKKGQWQQRTELNLSRLVTVCWGVLTLGFAFFVGRIADTVLEAINMIGSLINGPVLAVFALGLLTRRANGNGAVAGLLGGFGLNLYCWVAVPTLSWLWWNAFGFGCCFLVGYLVSLISGKRNTEHGLYWHSLGEQQNDKRWKKGYLLLVLWALVILLVAWGLERL
ncbi:sodium:solute symporter family transporter [Gallaecimonas mangrovi]|uniref:sodium:solute symporter family transporter n=1 Tax=Gallaecimonas mangrovi TaxID=2291597 RepID=UPI000E2091E1|nr:sodium/solute symporter [Gallaecimonas mangrovi]